MGAGPVDGILTNTPEMRIFSMGSHTMQLPERNQQWPFDPSRKEAFAIDVKG